MKYFIIILITFIITSAVQPQSIVIGVGAEMNIGSGADLCATAMGNITGNITGSGTQCNGILPVLMSNFSSTVFNATNVKLSWRTISEINNSGFEVYRSENNTAVWSMIGFVQGMRTKNTPTDYTYTDNKLNAGKYYYRLKQIDYNGNYTIYDMSGYANINSPDKFKLSQNYPNPFNPVTKIDFQIPVDSRVTIKVYDISGREMAVLMNNEQKAADFYSVEFNASKLSSGIYFYKIQAGKYSEIKKMLVIK